MPRRPTGRPPGRPRHPEPLTPAEQRVLEHVRLGLTNVEIAVRLGISPDTVKTHVAHMLAKLDLNDRSELAAWQPDRNTALLPLTLLTGAVHQVGRTAPTVFRQARLASAIAALGLIAITIMIARHRGQPDGSPAVQLATSATPSATPTVTTVPAVPDTPILFVGSDGSVPESAIYAVEADGSALQELTDDEDEIVLSPSWSPDGKRFAYISVPSRHRGIDVTRADLMVATHAGGGALTLVERVAVEPVAAAVVDPVWLPDGSGVMFSQGQTEDGRGFGYHGAVIPGLQNTVPPPAFLGCETGAISPDGQYVACAGGKQIGIGRADQPGYSLIARRSDEDGARQPVISPDGRWIAWWGIRRGERPHVYVGRFDGSGGSIDLGEGIRPGWSPAGNRIVFVRGPGGIPSGLVAADPNFASPDAAGDIYLYDVDQALLRNLTESASSESWPAWSPDGGDVAFVSDRDHQPDIYVMRDDGSNVRRVTRTTEPESMLEWAAPYAAVPLAVAEPADPAPMPGPTRVLVRGRDIPYRTCTTGEAWAPPAAERHISPETAPARSLTDPTPHMRRQLRRPFFYLPQASRPSNWSTENQDVVDVLKSYADDSPADVCDIPALTTPPVVTRSVAVFGSRILRMRGDERVLVVQVEPAGGHWEQAYLPYPADVSLPWQTYYFEHVYFVDASGKVLRRWR